MHIHIHIPTLYLALTLLAPALSLTTFLATSPHEPQGSRYWSAAFLLHGTFYALLLLRGKMSPILTIVVCNVCSSASFAMLCEGIFQFQQRRHPRLMIWAPPAVILLSFPFALDNIRLRIMIAGTLVSLQCLQILSTLSKGRRNSTGTGQYIVATGIALTAMVLVVRVLSALWGPPKSSVSMAPDPVEIASALNGLLDLILISHGLMVMIKDRADQRLRDLVAQDPLTGLANRRGMNEALATEWSRATGGGAPLAVLMLDVDSFKAFNDTYGHQAGDDCLVAIARVLQTAASTPSALAARYGGEEFLLLAPGLPPEAARTLAEHIRARVAALDMPHSRSRFGKVTVSVGLAVTHERSHEDVDAVLREADQALYMAKQKGGNLVQAAAGPHVSPITSQWGRIGEAPSPSLA